MRITALLNPEIFEADFYAKSFCPEEVRAAFVHRNNLVISDFWADPFFLSPDRGAVGPGCCLVPFVEKLSPVLWATILEGLHVVGDF